MGGVGPYVCVSACPGPLSEIKPGRVGGRGAGEGVQNCVSAITLIKDIIHGAAESAVSSEEKREREQGGRREEGGREGRGKLVALLSKSSPKFA